MKAFTFCFLLTLGCFINSISAQNDSMTTALEDTLRAHIDEHLGVKEQNTTHLNTLKKTLKSQIDKQENRLEIAKTYDEIGKIYENIESYGDALFYYEKALIITQCSSFFSSFSVFPSFFC